MHAGAVSADGRISWLVRARLTACRNEAGTGKPRGGAMFPVVEAVLFCYAGL